MKKVSSLIFAGALLLGACSTTQTASVETTDDYGQVRAEATADASAQPITGPAKVDSTGRVYTSSATGSGNSATLGTNTNVNIIPEEPSARVTVAQSNIITEPIVEPLEGDLVITESTSMISSSQSADTTPAQSTTTTTTMTSNTTADDTTTQSTTRTRMRKD